MTSQVIKFARSKVICTYKVCMAKYKFCDTLPNHVQSDSISMSDFLQVIRCFVGWLYSIIAFMFVPSVVCTLSLAYRRCTYAMHKCRKLLIV